jgi:glycerol uptake facilitator-like aquaporin
MQAIPDGHSVLQGCIGEFAAAFILIFLVCSTALDKKGNPQRIPLVMAITVPMLLYTVGPVSSMCINPARALGPAVASGFWQHHWVWWTAPILGALTAVLPYKYMSDWENRTSKQS